MTAYVAATASWEAVRDAANSGSAGQPVKHYLAGHALALRLMNYDAETVRTAMNFGSGKYDGPLVGRLCEALVVLSVHSDADASFAKIDSVVV